LRDIDMLLRLRDATNDSILIEVIDHIIATEYPVARAELVDMMHRAGITISPEGSSTFEKDLISFVISLGGWMAGDAVLDNVVKAAKPIYYLYKLADTGVTISNMQQRNISHEYRIHALQGLREAVWQAYGTIINAGRTGNQYTEDDLLTAHNLFMWSWYLTQQQLLWTYPMLTNRTLGDLLVNPITRAGRWWDDETLQEELRQVNWVSAPVWYPYSFSSQLTSRNSQDHGVIQGATVASHDPSGWAIEQVRTAIGLGLVPQNLQSYYTQATTRAEFAALVVALYEIQQGTITGRVNFADTNDVNVQKAAYIGVLTGIGDNNFAPNNPLTREQAAVMLARLADAVGSPLPASTPDFLDYRMISPWAFDYVGQVQRAGIMVGVAGHDGGATFFPVGHYTREQSIATILRLFNIVR